MQKPEDIAEAIRQAFPGAKVAIVPPKESYSLEIDFDDKRLGLDVECLPDGRFWVSLNTETYLYTGASCPDRDELLKELSRRYGPKTIV